MYFPYLRGKLFELIALREIKDILYVNRHKVSPIIEPVKALSAKDKVFPTLKKTLVDLKLKDINFSFVINPSIVDTVDTYDLLAILEETLNGYSNFQISIIIEKDFSIDSIITLLEQIKFNFNGLTLIHNHAFNNTEEIINSLSRVKRITYNVINFKKTNRRYYTNFDKNTVVSLDDFFNIQPKNANYLEIDNSPFSEEYMFYKDDGFAGFSDFLTIGDIYIEGGFLPYAVAIHISYLENNKIRIKHFVSDSNSDTSDVAGKFAEARDKLVLWCDEQKLDTHAIREFKNLKETGHFPGLGSIKKLSIMHHIEFVLSLIKQ